MGLKCCIRQVEIVVLSRLELCLPAECYVRVNCALRPAFLPRLCRPVDRIVVQVCWRKLACPEDSSKHLEDSTEDRPRRRQRADNSVEALWESAPDNMPVSMFIQDNNCAHLISSTFDL